MKYNEKMVLISEKSYQELVKKYNEDKSTEKIYNSTREEEKKKEEKIKKENKCEEESTNFKQEEEKDKKEIESIEGEEEENDETDNTIVDLPLNPSDFFSNEALTKQDQEPGKIVNVEEWQRHKKKRRSGRKIQETAKKKPKKMKWIHLK
jgi:hypothetical protein